jgi:hypothetical protein
MLDNIRELAHERRGPPSETGAKSSYPVPVDAKI